MLVALLKCGHKLTSAPETFAGAGHKDGPRKCITSGQYVLLCDKLVLLIIFFGKQIFFLMMRAQFQLLFINTSGLKIYLILMKSGSTTSIAKPNTTPTILHIFPPMLSLM